MDEADGLDGMDQLYGIIFGLDVIEIYIDWLDGMLTDLLDWIDWSNKIV